MLRNKAMDAISSFVDDVLLFYVCGNFEQNIANISFASIHLFGNIA